MKLNKREVKVLKYIRRKHFVKKYILDGRFGASTVMKLETGGFIRCDYQPVQDDEGFDSSPAPLDTHCYLSDSGIVEVESHDWFNLDYVLRNILLPIAVAVASTLITLALSHVL